MRSAFFSSALALCFSLFGNGCSKGITRSTAATVFFVRGKVVYGTANRNDFQPVTSKSKIHAGDTVRTSEDASVNLALIPGAFVQVSANSEIEIKELTVTKDGNETAGGILHRHASMKLTRGRLVGLFSHSDTSASEFYITTDHVTLRPDSDCLFSISRDNAATRVACGRGEVNAVAEAQSSVKIAAGYFSQWPTTSKEPSAAITDGVAQMDIRTALDVETELMDQAAGWQNRRAF